MANWYQDQITNKNFLSPIGFIFLLEKAKKVSFLCQKAEIPSVSVGNIDIPTRGMARIPIEGNVVYGDLSLEFVVDEDLQNYMEIHNWIRALGTPQDFKERKEWVDKFSRQESDARFSDATLQVLNNNNLVNFDVVFKQLFPIELTSLPFDVTQTDNEYFTATAMFKYMLYEVRNKNTQTRR
tara:strand:+ start:1143 stop:1688 length:546 start_codon:yes stop_codon:yes gene_type:complete